MVNHKLYRRFTGIKQRCTNPKTSKYSLYGGKGIKCLWKSFEEFFADMGEPFNAHVALYGVKNTSLDRIDGNGNYCKENCKWVTYKEQALNMSTNRFYSYNGETLCITEWARKFNVSPACLSYRLKKYDNDFSKCVENPIRYLRKV